MAKSTLGVQHTEISNGLDGIVIVNALGDLPGGRTLDLTGYDKPTVAAGHVIIKTAAGEYKPLGVTSGAYASLAEGEAYVGILKASVLASDPRAAILTLGQVNAAAAAKAVGAPYTDAIKTGLSHIQFLY